MPSEETNSADNVSPNEAGDRSSGYEYSSSEGSDGSNRDSSDRSGSSGSTGVTPPAASKRPLGLQRSDRNRGLSSSGSGLSGGSSVRVSGIQTDITQDVKRLVQQGLRDLESQRRSLQKEVDQLERRKERLEAEMRTSFAGSSQDIAIRVQGFKNYLVGSLQDLVSAAEEMDLTPAKPAVSEPVVPTPAVEDTEIVPLAAQRFAQQRDRINSLLDQYRTLPDYYGPPWQLRRTFEPVHADRASNWFFTQGGHGAIKSMGSRLQNVLVASATVSCMHSIYNQRLCVLVLATTPERLGEWRRWLQDCLGIARADFGTNRGVMLFEAPEPMTQRAERLLDSGRVPFLIMDEAEDKVSLSLLQFPLWLGFAPDPENPSADYDYY